METSKSAKIQIEIDKVKKKISGQQNRLRELERSKTEAENSEIVDIVRGMSVPLDELPVLLQKLRAEPLGQSVPKPAAPYPHPHSKRRMTPNEKISYVSGGPVFRRSALRLRRSRLCLCWRRG